MTSFENADRSSCSLFAASAPGLALAALVLLSAPACAPGGRPTLTEASSSYSPVQIAVNAPSLPGTISWSPDNRQIAFNNGTLTIVDTDSLELRPAPVAQPLSVAWAGDGRLYALSRVNGKSSLSVIDPDRLTATKLPLDRDADMLYPLDAACLILASARTNPTRIGTELSWNLSRYALATGTTQTLSSFSKIYPWKIPDSQVLLAWLHAGVNPLDRSFLIMEHLRPPVVAPYSRISRIDTLTGAELGTGSGVRGNLYASASWSPDGRRFALADQQGMLEVRTLEDERAMPLPASGGLYPSWNPKGGVIYMGGFLIKSNGTASTQVLANASRSLGVWSPDGTRLAVAADGRLLLFRNISPSFSGADGPLDSVLADKLALLRNLFTGGLITRQDYDERRSRLLETREGHP